MADDYTGFFLFLLNDFLLPEDCGKMDLDMLEEHTAAESASEAVPLKHWKLLRFSVII